MIVANSYFSPFQLKNKRWPPTNAIHTIYADGVPVCAVLERLTKDDLAGIQALERGDYINSALLFRKAQELDPQNELICYKFAVALLVSGQTEQAQEMLLKCLEMNPDYEKALALSGDLALKQGDAEKAEHYYQKTIQANRKYLSVYPKLAAIYAGTNAYKARKVLRDCLEIDPKYKSAIRAIAETYRKIDPEKAKNMEEKIDQIK